MKIQCPKCQMLFDTPEIYAGKTYKCPKCQHAFVARKLPAGGYLAVWSLIFFVISIWNLFLILMDGVFLENKLDILRLTIVGIGSFIAIILCVILLAIRSLIAAININTKNLPEK